MLRRINLPSVIYYGVLAAALSAAPAFAEKLDPPSQSRAAEKTGQSSVIVRVVDGQPLEALDKAIAEAGGSPGRRLPIIHARVVTLPHAALAGFCHNSNVEHCSLDRLSFAAMERTGPTVGSTAVRQAYGYDGSGIGVAVIDSGVTPWHDDLATSTLGAQRVDRFVDFVGGQTTPYDDNGHGTHVAGIIGGNGYDSGGLRAAIAPGAHLIVLKVLDGTGAGHVSDVIAALDYVVNNKAALNIRVCNISIAAGVYESYNTDPLTLAAQKAANAGIVVVAAAGNYGKSSTGTMEYGGITAPGNSPWVLTVGASSHMGTIDRSDDTMAAFSSRGPSAIDANAKPDVVAPGVGIESLSNPNSALYTTYSAYLLNGTVSTTYLPYLSLSGTSMASPVVAGTVALMMQANPALTPNAVKAVLQYTAEAKPGYDPLTEGGGFLNAKGAVDLARWLAAPSSTYPASSGWSQKIIWGNHEYGAGRLGATANAWPTNVPWGASVTATGKSIVFGVDCSIADCSSLAKTAWGVWDASRNVVWGNECGGANCTGAWNFSQVAAYATTTGDTVVWGSGNGDTVVWGSGDGDTVVWGSGGTDTVVWGATCGDTSCVPIIWNR